MNIIELKKIIDEKTNNANQLHKQLNSLHNEINNLRNQFNQLEMDEFVNYLQIGEIIELNSYYSFSGYFLKKHDTEATNSFTSGEMIKIVKKNKKSIVIEVIKKFKRHWNQNQKKSVIIGETNPGWNIRVNLDSFFHFYLKNSDRKTAFDSYIKRKHALDSLFDE